MITPPPGEMEVSSSGTTTWPLVLMVLTIVLNTIDGLEVTNINVPRIILSGSDVRLQCNYTHYTNSIDPLYSIKWYRDQDQFYEYVPKRYPEPMKVYHFPGLNVRKAESNGTSVLLGNVTKLTSGTFKCEVMGDKPFFDTHSRSTNMTVADVPQWGPTITGAMDGEVMRAGQMVILSCNVDHIDPPPNMTWYLNRRAVDSYHIQPPRVQSYRNAMLLKSEIRILLEDSHFQRGVLGVTCEVRIDPVYCKETQISILNVHQPQPSGFGWFASGSSIHSTPSMSNLLVSTSILVTSLSRSVRSLF